MKTSAMPARRRACAVAALLGTALAAPSAFAQDRAELLGKLPSEVQSLYTDVIEVGPSAYDNYSPPQKPWRWCHSESYMGNPWRVTMNDELKRLVEAVKTEGLISEYLVSDSNGDPTQQISQIRSFIERDCSIITMIAGSSTALNQAIDDAFNAGIAVVTTAGAVTTPNALNVMHNQYLWGYEMGKSVAEETGGKGNVLQVEGISGHPLVQQENAGLDAALAENTELTKARTVTGEWTASVTKSAVLQALATIPQPIDAVWTTGSETRVIAEAFEQAGRPIPLITGSITGDALGYWHENQDEFRFTGGTVSPHVAAHNVFKVGMRLLSGQKPLVNTIVAPMPTIQQADLPNWYQDCMKPDSSSLFPIPPQDPFPEEILNGYFSNPAPTPVFDYSKVPPSCPS